MPTIQINNEILNFDNIFYCNSEIGSDSNDGLTETTPVKTIQAAINKTDTTKTAIVLSPSSIFSGAVPNSGLVNIPSGKQITFIGKINGENFTEKEIPIPSHFLLHVMMIWFIWQNRKCKCYLMV